MGVDLASARPKFARPTVLDSFRERLTHRVLLPVENLENGDDDRRRDRKPELPGVPRSDEFSFLWVVIPQAHCVLPLITFSLPVAVRRPSTGCDADTHLATLGTETRCGAFPWAAWSGPNAPTSPMTSPSSFRPHAARFHTTGGSFSLARGCKKYQSVAGMIALYIFLLSPGFPATGRHAGSSSAELFSVLLAVLIASLRDRATSARMPGAQQLHRFRQQHRLAIERLLTHYGRYWSRKPVAAELGSFATTDLMTGTSAINVF